MKRRQADVVVGVLVLAVAVLGVLLALQPTGRGSGGHMMDSMMGSTTTGTNTLWFALGTFLVAALVGVAYLTVRDDLTESDRPTRETPSGPGHGTADAEAAEPAAEIDAAAQSRGRVLDLLPDDERRVLEPVLTSPGITQIELRDRSEFSKSKVSQTVSALEKRGLLYREPQGRTYRIYPGDELDDGDDEE